ncbi:MAG: response regulator transcription factor [Candidatus Omnitrophica bacterium]|nr:response regulator transcription factor [Candidatus Omnitrophota bacterium]
MISEKIVVIDDDPRIVKSIRLAFPEYEFMDFSNGEDALDYLRKPNNINVVLLDFMMPKMDGISVLSRIKKHMNNIGVILMTGYGSKDIILDALRNHADDFIEKPIQMPELKDKLRFLIKERLYAQNIRNDKHDRMGRIKRFIERNCSNVNLDYIANELCLSPRYVSRFFNRHNDVSYRGFRLQMKMNRAKKLLAETCLDVCEIAIELGYQNPESFMRIFKRMTKMTPTQYRKKNGSKRVRKSCQSG